MWSRSSFFDWRNGCMNFCLPCSWNCCSPWFMCHDKTLNQQCITRSGSPTMINHLTTLLCLDVPTIQFWHKVCQLHLCYRVWYGVLNYVYTRATQTVLHPFSSAMHSHILDMLLWRWWQWQLENWTMMRFSTNRRGRKSLPFCQSPSFSGLSSWYWYQSC